MIISRLFDGDFTLQVICHSVSKLMDEDRVEGTYPCSARVVGPHVVVVSHQARRRQCSTIIHGMISITIQALPAATISSVPRPLASMT